MGFDNPIIPWRELERRLSDRAGTPQWSSGDRRSGGAPSNGAGVVRSLPRSQAGRGSGLPRVPYAELHARSRFSFMDGSSNPEELVAEAVRLELDALAITDRDGFYGVVRFAEAAEEAGLPTVFGAELTLDLPGSSRRSSPARASERRRRGRSVVVLARDPAGYAALGSLISKAHMAGRKGEPRLSTETFLEAAAAHRDRWAILTGAHDGTVPSALVEHGPRAAAAALDRLTGAAGAGNVYVELWDHGDPLDGHRNDALAELGVRQGFSRCAPTRCATPRRPTAVWPTPWPRPATGAASTTMTAGSVPGAEPMCAPGPSRPAASPATPARWRPRPGWDRSAPSACRWWRRNCRRTRVPTASTKPPSCAGLAAEGARDRYGPPEAERVAGAWHQVEHELDMIEQLGFCGYFLVVWDITSFCRSRDIYCQGRGSAANSAVCYVLGITNVDSVELGLLFERFLSPERDGPPDIDIDIESGRREEVIQYVYGRYGRDRTALVANVIAYRARSAVRDMARALGHPPARQDAWAKSLDRRGGLGTGGGEGDPAEGADIPADVLALAVEAEGGPRHLGIHPGGMVICDRPIAEVCPVEWASMADRSVLQWDKDDCAAAGLVKFDLLGLGMLSALHYAVDLVASAHGERIDLAALPQDPAVYDMLCEADSVGVFQVESRAQMATLPRLRPRCFYDLVVEVALIRPGPIQGGSVHPYIRRRNGVEPVTYLHPLLERSLAKTLGVPLFQEQLMQMDIDVAGFTPAESDELRRAMGAKRSVERMERLKGRFFAGMAERGVGAEAGEQIWHKMVAFATYGFPESHSVSFSYLVYASAWIKLHYPAAFCAALLNAQPMGFYSPHSLCQDARRHGVVVHGPDINLSAGTAVLEPCETSTGGVAVRLGLSSVRGMGSELADAIAAGAPYDSMEHLVRDMSAERPLDLPVLEALAAAGAFDSLGLDRREALWTAGAAVQSGASRLPGTATGMRVPELRPMSPPEQSAADLWTTGVAPDGHPTRFHRSELDAAGVVAAADLLTCPVGRIKVAGTVSHRQRPMTAGGTMFINLEDETGFVNVIVSKGCQARFRKTVLMSRALMVRGRLERHEARSTS